MHMRDSGRHHTLSVNLQPDGPLIFRKVMRNRPSQFWRS